MKNLLLEIPITLWIENVYLVLQQLPRMKGTVWYNLTMKLQSKVTSGMRIQTGKLNFKIDYKNGNW